MLTTLLLRYGYATIFVAAALEGEATLLTGTFLAHRGYFRLGLVMLVAAAATVSINQVYFWLGRRYGQRYFSGKRNARVYASVSAWIARYGVHLVMGSRFMFGFRIAIPAACGASGMSPMRFVAGDIVGATAWAVVVGLAGYGVGHFLDYVIDDLRRHEWWIALALLVAALVGLAFLGRDWLLARASRPRADAATRDQDGRTRSPGST